MKDVSSVKPLTNENWHRVVGVLMLKLGFTDIEIIPDDILRLGEGMMVIADCRGGRFFVRIMAEIEFDKITKEEGVTTV